MRIVYIIVFTSFSLSTWADNTTAKIHEIESEVTGLAMSRGLNSSSQTVKSAAQAFFKDAKAMGAACKQYPNNKSTCEAKLSVALKSMATYKKVAK